MEVSTTSKKSTIFEECANCAASGNSVTLKSCAKCMLVKYCGRACQLQHWKNGGHKLFCIASASRVPQVPSQPESQLHSTEKISHEEECPICFEKLYAMISTLPCDHIFHADCISSLRKYGVNECCPLCRGPLPPGPEDTFKKALSRFLALERRIMGSWIKLSKRDRKEVNEIEVMLKSAADQGYAVAQCKLGLMVMELCRAMLKR